MKRATLLPKTAQTRLRMLTSRWKFFAAFLLLSAFAWPAFAYTSPGNPSWYVNDFADVLSVETKTELESTLAQFHADTGADIAVAVVPTLGGDDIESYANTLFREWGIGKKDADTGILLVVAIEERKVRIEVGYGYEGDVPDAYSSRIINDDILPRFKEADYDNGIKNGVASLITLIRNPSSVPPIEEEHNSFSFENFGVLGYLFFGFIAWLGSVLARSKSWWGGGIIGGVIALVVGFVGGTALALISALPLIGLGLLFDFAVSSAYKESRRGGVMPPWWAGGGGFGSGSSSGGFGGFWGGSFGGGGASGSW